jgi:hypothetical protein
MLAGSLCAARVSAPNGFIAERQSEFQFLQGEFELRDLGINLLGGPPELLRKSTQLTGNPA